MFSDSKNSGTSDKLLGAFPRFLRYSKWVKYKRLSFGNQSQRDGAEVKMLTLHVTGPLLSPGITGVVSSFARCGPQTAMTKNGNTEYPEISFPFFLLVVVVVITVMVIRF